MLMHKISCSLLSKSPHLPAVFTMLDQAIHLVCLSTIVLLISDHICPPF